MMTDLQRIIIEASNSDLITTAEASMLLSTIYTESVTDIAKAQMDKVKSAFSKYSNNMKSAFSKMKKDMSVDKNRKLLVDSRTFEILKEFEKFHAELKKTDDKKRQKELSKKTKELSKEIRKCRTTLYKEGSKVPSGMKVIEASKLLDTIQATTHKTAMYDGTNSFKNFVAAMSASITMLEGINHFTSNVEWWAGLTNAGARYMLDDYTSQLNRDMRTAINHMNMNNNMMAMDIANQASMMAMQQSMSASNIGASLAMSGGTNPAMFGM